MMCVCGVPALAQVPEVKLALSSLREGERARLEKALGPAENLPLYRVDLNVNPKTRVVTGSVSLLFTARRPMSDIALRVVPNANTPDAVTVTAAFINGSAARTSRVDAATLRLRPDAAIAEGQAVLVDMKLKARVPKAPEIALDPDSVTRPKGGDYGAFSSADEVTCLAGIVPSLVPVIDGVAEGPPSGIGDLGTFDPSNWIVGVQVPKGYAAVAPGEKLGEVPDAEGATRFTYALAAARDLPVLVTRDYVVKTETLGDITVESHFAAEDKTSGRDALDIAVKALEDLNSRVGPYPYKTFRIVEGRLGGGAGGMEFPGLVTVSAMLYKGAVNPLSVLGMGGGGASQALLQGVLGSDIGAVMGDTLEFTVDHEVAHQYIAMLVGNDAVGAPVVDEPLTQHLALLLREWHHGAEAAESMRAAQLKASFQLHRMMGGSDGPAIRPTSGFHSNSEYAAIIYGKAPLLFDQQRALIGDAAWLKVLKTYVAENRYKWVNVNTLPQLAARLHPTKAKALEALRRHWWEESHGDEDITGFDMGMLTGAGGNSSATPQQQQQLQQGLQGIDPQVLHEYMEAIRALAGESAP